MYDHVRKDLDPKTRLALDRIFRPFFWKIDWCLADIPGFPPNECITTVLSPETVAEMAVLTKSLDLESLREPFARRCGPTPDQWMSNFEEFRDYLKQWFDMLRGARGPKKAVVLWIA